MCLACVSAERRYKFFIKSRTWVEALKACRSIHGAELASITTLSEIKKVKKTLGVKNNSYFWVGAAGKWSWSRRNGDYIWKHKNGLQVRECGAYSSKSFVRGDCRRKLPYICMRDREEVNKEDLFHEKHEDYRSRYEKQV
jgi:hypothetical protein